MTLLRRANGALLGASVALLAIGACKHKDEPPAPYPQGASYPPPQYYPPPPQYYPPQPAPWATRPSALPPAFGFFCQTDKDLQCPYGRCIGGRCGGCSDASQCKRGTSCLGSPVGMSCWPGQGGGNAPPPVPSVAPVPSVPPPGTPSFPPAPSVPPNATDPFARARQICVDRINGYRARLSRAPVARDASSEPCIDEESRLDARSNTAHGTFGKCGELAQNACPNYPGPVEDGLVRCLDQMFAEGPGGGHYENMMSVKYTRASCGFVALNGGRLWMIQDFR